MANHVSAIKRAKQNEARRMRNRGYRTQVRNAVKAVRAAILANDQEAAGIALKGAVSTIDRVAGKGVLPARTASRYVARLSAQIAKLNV